MFDTSTLIYLLRPNAPAPMLRSGKGRVPQCQNRIAYLLTQLQASKATIVIPSPTIAELLVHADLAAPDWLRILTASKHFRPAPFDALAAVECALMTRKRLGAGKLSAAVRTKAKFDEQIVAIARVERANVIYSDDADIAKLAGGITVRGVEDLDLPPIDAQGRLDLEPSTDPQEPPSSE